MRHGWSARVGLCALLLLFLAAPARTGPTYVSQGVLHYDATAGEQDDVVLAPVPEAGNDLYILGTGTPGAGCSLYERAGDLTRELQIARLRMTLPFDDMHDAEQRLSRVAARLN